MSASEKRTKPNPRLLPIASFFTWEKKRKKKKIEREREREGKKEGEKGREREENKV